MSEPDFQYFRTKNSDKPLAQRVYAGLTGEPGDMREIGLVWRAWGGEKNDKPAWVTRLTLNGPDLTVEPTKHAASMVLWRIAAVREEQSAPERDAVAV